MMRGARGVERGALASQADIHSTSRRHFTPVCVPTLLKAASAQLLALRRRWIDCLSSSLPLFLSGPVAR